MFYQDDAARAAGLWRYRATVRLPSGEVARISGTAQIKGKGAARDALDAHKRLLFLAPFVGRRGSKLFSTFAAEWLERYPASVGNRASSRDEKETHLRVRILPFFGRTILRDIDAKMIARFVAELETAPPVAPARRPLKPKTIRNIVQNLRKILTTAEEWGEMDKCPTFPKMKRPPKPPIAFYTRDELARLLDAVTNERLPGLYRGGRDGAQARAALLVASKCGLRAGELLGLTWEQVTFTASGGELRIDRQRHRGVPGPVKAGERTVPMSGSVAAALKELRNLTYSRNFEGVDATPWPPSGPVFNEAGRPWTIATLRALLARAVGRTISVRLLRWHDLRHTFASHLAQAGVPLIQIKDWLGHTSINMTMRYAHLAPKGNAHLVAMLDAALDSAVP